MENGITYEEVEQVEDYLNGEFKVHLANGWEFRFMVEITAYSNYSMYLFS